MHFNRETKLFGCIIITILFSFIFLDYENNYYDLAFIGKEVEVVYETKSIKKETIKEEKPQVITLSVTSREVASSQVAKTVSYVPYISNEINGESLTNYAKNYLGLLYVSSGDSLSTGTDCSGFTRLIFAEFGVSLGRTVYSQMEAGEYVPKESLEKGDLVFYGYNGYATHVAIYIGDGQVIHQSNPRDGVKISSLGMMEYITARRVLIGSNTKVVEEEKEEVAPEESEEPSESGLADEVSENDNENVDNTTIPKTEEKIKEIVTGESTIE